MSDDAVFWDPADEPYGGLSNLYGRPILLDGVVYRTAEHAIKAAQAKRPEVRQWLMDAPTPELASIAGGGLPDGETVEGWDAMRLPVMRSVLEAKFAQHDDLAQLLASTASRRIVELAPSDDPINRFWSEIEGTGLGENWLGRLLMEVRASLPAFEKTFP